MSVRLLLKTQSIVVVCRGRHHPCQAHDLLGWADTGYQGEVAFNMPPKPIKMCDSGKDCVNGAIYSKKGIELCRRLHVPSDHPCLCLRVSFLRPLNTHHLPTAAGQAENGYDSTSLNRIVLERLGGQHGHLIAASLNETPSSSTNVQPPNFESKQVIVLDDMELASYVGPKTSGISPGDLLPE